MFIYFFIGVLLSGLLYLYLRFVTKLTKHIVIRLGIFLVLVSVIILTWSTFYFKLNGIHGLKITILSWTAYTGIGFLSFLFTFLLIRDLIIGGAWTGRRLLAWINRSEKKPESSHSHSPHRRLFMANTLNSFIAGGAFIFTGAGVYGATKTPDVKRVMLPVKNLPESLHSFTIVQITDIHISSTCKREFLERVVSTVNSLNPDLIALTGDLADGYADIMTHDVEPLRRLKAPFGKYFITGNHEYYFNAETWCQKVTDLGFSTLLNTHSVINKNSGKILLAGVTDYYGGRFINSHASDPAKAISGAPPCDVSILLAHQPKSVFDAAGLGYDIQISGHTHGGQFFPWQLAISLDQPYVAGLYRHEDILLYVSRGTGYWGPPVRLGSPSEITLLELVPA